MPLKDEDLKTIGQLTQLRKLNLSFTGIKGTNLDELNKLKELKQLTLSGNQLNMVDVKKIVSLPQLSKLFLWSTGIKDDELKQLQQSNKDLAIETGFRGDTLTLKLTCAGSAKRGTDNYKTSCLKLKHYINGVTIRYTLRRHRAR
jgi:Leucine-rich repeat (LRR) protein